MPLESVSPTLKDALAALGPKTCRYTAPAHSSRALTVPEPSRRTGEMHGATVNADHDTPLSRECHATLQQPATVDIYM